MLGFLIEAEIWEDDENRILAALLDKGIPHALHPLVDFDPSVLDRLDTPLIFCYGSLQWIAQVQAINDPRLRTVCSIPNFDCRVYYPYFQGVLFNRTHKIVPLSEFVAEFDHLLQTYDDKLFMRPCTGFKSGSISGGVFDRATFDEYISFFQEELKPEDLLVVDRVRHIDYEWRTIVCGKKCVTGCQYGSFDVETQKFGFDPSPSFPDRVRVKVEEIVSDITWAPDPVYVLDVAQSDCELSVMEINALSTSGWYDCDIGAIVDAICGIMSMEGNHDHRHERIDSSGSNT